MGFRKDMFSDGFRGRYKVENKSQMSATLAANRIPRAIVRRGRRERQGAGEEKEEGLLGTVDCVFER